MSVDCREAFPCSLTTDDVQDVLVSLGSILIRADFLFAKRKSQRLRKRLFDANYRRIKIRNFLGEFGEKQQAKGGDKFSAIVFLARMIRSPDEDWRRRGCEPRALAGSRYEVSTKRSRRAHTAYNVFPVSAAPGRRSRLGGFPATRHGALPRILLRRDRRRRARKSTRRPIRREAAVSSTSRMERGDDEDTQNVLTERKKKEKWKKRKKRESGAGTIVFFETHDGRRYPQAKDDIARLPTSTTANLDESTSPTPCPVMDNKEWGMRNRAACSQGKSRVFKFEPGKSSEE